jgi:hypothetical protein
VTAYPIYTRDGVNSKVQLHIYELLRNTHKVHQAILKIDCGGEFG